IPNCTDISAAAFADSVEFTFFSERICDSQMSVLFSIYLICVQRSISAFIRTIPRAVTFTLKFFSADNALLYHLCFKEKKG
ncbi:MAG: hypothetical protein E6Z10_05385, partial [Ruminococcus sp.]|nr:hypothetical protein [Ruminococcus sp.]